MESFSPPKDPSADANDIERELKPNNNKVAVDPKMVADKLLAALASGNLEHLEQARLAFVAESKVEIPAVQERSKATPLSVPARSRR